MRSEQTMKRTLLSSLVLGPALLLGAMLAPGTVAAASPAIDLYTGSGTATMPDGANVTVWGYGTAPSPVITAPGGPTLVVNAGDTPVITLHNSLPEATGLLFDGVAMAPDLTGAPREHRHEDLQPPGHEPRHLPLRGRAARRTPSTRWRWGSTASSIVRPATAGQAYADARPAPTTTRRLSSSARSTRRSTTARRPATFDMRNYAPRYFLVNGKASPATAPIVSTAGARNKVLLRYANAGLNYALDGHPGGLPDGHRHRRQPPRPTRTGSRTRRSRPARRPTPSSPSRPRHPPARSTRSTTAP